jgi:hypothetical protein
MSYMSYRSYRSYGKLFLTTLAVLGACANASAEIAVDKDKRTITVDAKMAPRKIDAPGYDKIYPLEVVACWPWQKGVTGKAHETVVTITAKPSEIHKALVETFGLKPGTPQNGGDKPGEGPEVNIYLEFQNEANETKRVPIEKTMIDAKTNKGMGKLKWRFTGSVMAQPDPNKPDKVYGADTTGTLICIFPVTDLTVFQTNLKFKDQTYVDLETDKKLLPKIGTPVKLVIEVPKQK